jgi:hypothetical protein
LGIDDDTVKTCAVVQYRESPILEIAVPGACRSNRKTNNVPIAITTTVAAVISAM